MRAQGFEVGAGVELAGHQPSEGDRQGAISLH